MKAAAWPMRRAVDAVRNGGVIAYPTEAIYGLGCDPLEYEAVNRIFDLKGRDIKKGLILIAARVEQLLPFMARLPDPVMKKLEASWPGPVTWVVPAAPSLPFWLSGGRDTLAVRVTAHALTRQLCEACDMALVSTSANQSGQSPARSALQVRATFGDKLDYVLNGELGGLKKPTEIRDASTGKVLRAG